MTSTSDNQRPKRPDHDQDPIASAVRRSRQERRLPPDAACALCGETNVTVLAKREVHRSILELHHVLTESSDEHVVVVLCLNCHTRATAAQMDAGVLLPHEPRKLLDWLPLALRSLGSFFQLLADWCFVTAAGLVAAVGCLDAAGVAWRHLPGMP